MVGRSQGIVVRSQNIRLELEDSILVNVGTTLVPAARQHLRHDFVQGHTDCD